MSFVLPFVIWALFFMDSLSGEFPSKSGSGGTQSLCFADPMSIYGCRAPLVLVVAMQLVVRVVNSCIVIATSPPCANPRVLLHGRNSPKALGQSCGKPICPKHQVSSELVVSRRVAEL